MTYGEIGENARREQSRRDFKADGSLSLRNPSRIETRSREIRRAEVSGVKAETARTSRRDLRETTKLLPIPVCFGIISGEEERGEDASARFVSTPAGKSAVEFERALSR